MNLHTRKRHVWSIVGTYTLKVTNIQTLQYEKQLLMDAYVLKPHTVYSFAILKGLITLVAGMTEQEIFFTFVSSLGPKASINEELKFRGAVGALYFEPFLPFIWVGTLAGVKDFFPISKLHVHYKISFTQTFIHFACFENSQF